MWLVDVPDKNLPTTSLSYYCTSPCVVKTRIQTCDGHSLFAFRHADYHWYMVSDILFEVVCGVVANRTVSQLGWKDSLILIRFGLIIILYCDKKLIIIGSKRYLSKKIDDVLGGLVCQLQLN